MFEYCRFLIVSIYLVYLHTFEKTNPPRSGEKLSSHEIYCVQEDPTISTVLPFEQKLEDVVHYQLLTHE